MARITRKLDKKDGDDVDLNQFFERSLNQGSLSARKGAGDEWSVTVKIPTDEQGFTERQCPDTDCVPRLFKVKGDLPESQHRCPYCSQVASSMDFATHEQVRYAKELVTREAHEAIEGALNDMVKNALGLDSRGKRKLGSGPFSMEMSAKFTPTPKRHVREPIHERPRRDVACPTCKVEHVVFGLATWCHACGTDIIGCQVAAECRDIMALLGDAVARRQEHGERLYAKLVENVLEDVVSTWEAVLRYLIERAKRQSGENRADIEQFLRKEIGNQLQNLAKAETILRQHLGINLWDGTPTSDQERARVLFEARHSVTHRLGMVDEKFQAKANTGVLGREVELPAGDVEWLVRFAEARLLHVWRVSFPKTGDASCG